MKRQYRSIITIFLVLSISTASLISKSAYAEGCWNNGTSVFFSNGIWFDRREDGKAAVAGISQLGLDNSIDANGVTYDLAYNFSFGTANIVDRALDFTNAILQKKSLMSALRVLLRKPRHGMFVFSIFRILSIQLSFSRSHQSSQLI